MLAPRTAQFLTQVVEIFPGTQPCSPVALPMCPVARQAPGFAQASAAQRRDVSCRDPLGETLTQLLGIVDHLRREFARFNLCAHLLDSRCLLFQLRR